MKFLLLATLLFTLAGCAAFTNTPAGPGPDGISGTPDDVAAGDSDATGYSKTLAMILSVLGFAGLGAGIVGATEVASDIVTNIQKRKKTA
tara:strand:+ start:1545 stop:1814 length:270 start_codon:yes stop_codon:yes gene_type:complete